MPNYDWLTPEQRDAIRAELERLSGGSPYTEEDVVRWARDPASPLHPLFEWDDAKAAEAQRRDELGLSRRDEPEA